MAFINITWNQSAFNHLHRVFREGAQFDAHMADLAEEIGDLMVQFAMQRIRSISARTELGMQSDVHYDGRGDVELQVYSSWEGYPTSEGDFVGDPGEAARRRWATLAHRFEYGYYPGAPRLQNPYNPAAGYTEPTPFIEPAFDAFKDVFYRDVRDLIGDVLRGRV